MGLGDPVGLIEYRTVELLSLYGLADPIVSRGERWLCCWPPRSLTPG